MLGDDAPVVPNVSAYAMPQKLTAIVDMQN